MTFRAILLGLLGAATVCGVTYFNDFVMRQTMFVGNNMPISVYGFLLFFVLVLNPLLRRTNRRLALSGREIAVVLVLTLAACCIPGSGLMRTFNSSLVLPFHQERTNPAWQERQLLQQVPPYVLTEVTPENDNEVLNGFVQGKGLAGKHIGLSEVPWRAWLPAFAFWVPVLLLFWAALLGLALVVHRQWSDHEQLPYPIAAFAKGLLPEEEGGMSAVLRNRLFWGGLVVVLAIHMNNYACRWFPDLLLPVVVSFDFSPLYKWSFFQTIQKGGGWHTLRPNLYFTVIAFAFFLPADVSFALGIGPSLWCFIAGTLAGYGISCGGASPNLQESLVFGAYLGTLLVILYTGRQYYLQVSKAVFGLPAADRPESAAVWGGRLFLLASLALVAEISLLGRLDWQVAVLLIAGALILFFVMSRIIAETGLFFIQAGFMPIGVLMGLFGPLALGPQALLICWLVTTVLLVDPREGFMPFTTNSLKLVDLHRIDLGRSARWMCAAVVIGLCVAIPVTLYFQYDRGVNMSDGWANYWVPQMPFGSALQAQQRLEAQDLLPEAQALHGWQRFTHMQIAPKTLTGLAVGLGLVLLFTAGRLHFSRWPVHPVMFLIWISYAGAIFAGSFLVGWLIKVGVTKYGGGAVYRRLKPLMYGLIAGEMLGGLAIIVVGAIYYFATGQPPKAFNILPL